MNTTLRSISSSPTLLIIALAVLAPACEKNDKPGATQTSSANDPPTTTVTTPAEPKTPAVPTSVTQTGMLQPVATWKDVGLSTPESVVYDDVADAYLVSNVDGQPGEMDGKGFISKLGPDGTVVSLKWIESGKNKVMLNAPKGMALTSDLIYVADIDTVRMFDRKTGAPKGEVKVPGASFLADVAVAGDGRVLVSDAGLKGAAGTEPSGSDAVYAIDKDKKVSAIAKGKDLGGPNGLAPAGDKTWVVGHASGELYSIDSKGKKGDVQKLPKGQLDGIVLVGDEMLVSSWEANAVYRGKPGGEFKLVIADVKSSADIGYDTKRGRVLVPSFKDSQVRAYEVK